MSEPTLLLADGGNTAPFQPLRPRMIRSAADARTAYESEVNRHAWWVALAADGLRHLVALRPRASRAGCLLVLKPVSPQRRAFVDTLFADVLAPAEPDGFLSARELVDVFRSPNAEDLFIGGDVDLADRVVILYRGNLHRIAVPFDWFKTRRGAPKPDFKDFAITDSGQTVRLGDYEAAADAILYEFDAGARRRMNQRAIREDQSFGGALRRLRLQRGVSRTAFPGIDAKTIARIERGEVETPHEATLAVIAKLLGVEPREIATY